jgi:hypothetical protein
MALQAELHQTRMRLQATETELALLRQLQVTMPPLKKIKKLQWNHEAKELGKTQMATKLRMALNDLHRDTAGNGKTLAEVVKNLVQNQRPIQDLIEIALESENESAKVIKSIKAFLKHHYIVADTRPKVEQDAVDAVACAVTFGNDAASRSKAAISRLLGLSRRSLEAAFEKNKIMMETGLSQDDESSEEPANMVQDDD